MKKIFLLVITTSLAGPALALVRSDDVVARLSLGASALYPLEGPEARDVSEQIKASAAYLAADNPALAPDDHFVLKASCPKRDAACISRIAQAKKLDLVFVGATRKTGGSSLSLTLVAVFTDGTKSEARKVRVDTMIEDLAPVRQLLAFLAGQMPPPGAPPSTPSTAAVAANPTVATPAPATAPAPASAPPPVATAPAAEPAPRAEVATAAPPEGTVEAPPPPIVTPPPPDAEAAPVAETPLQLRFRWGLDGQIGYFFGASAVDFGASGRAGVQLSDLLGVYADLGYTAGIGIGGSVSSNGASVSVSGVGYWHIGVMAELDLGVFFLAAGPFISNGGWGQVSQGADASGNTQQYVVAAGGWMPGLDVHLGFTFGSPQPSGRRSGFTLGIDLRTLYASLTSVQQTAGSGGASQSVRVGDHIFGVTPMLMLGYEAK